MTNAYKLVEHDGHFTRLFSATADGRALGKGYHATYETEAEVLAAISQHAENRARSGKPAVQDYAVTLSILYHAVPKA